MPMRMRVLGAADDDLRDIALKRSDLVQKAWTDHTEGRFHASIPVVMMVIDGVCAEATGGQFFSLGRAAADVADDSTLAGMSDSLPVVRRALAQRFDSTVASGALNRHGTLHGRELAYDTLTCSTKAFVLLVAVWEWAKPLLDAEAERRRADRLATWAGSHEVDSDGRRMDRRGFSATRLLLKDVALAQVAFHRQHGRFGTESELTEDAVTRSLRSHDDRVESLRSDVDSWEASHRSEAGWVFALGATGGDPSDWRYWRSRSCGIGPRASLTARSGRPVDRAAPVAPPRRTGPTRRRARRRWTAHRASRSCPR